MQLVLFFIFFAVSFFWSRQNDWNSWLGRIFQWERVNYSAVRQFGEALANTSYQNVEQLGSQIAVILCEELDLECAAVWMGDGDAFSTLKLTAVSGTWTSSPPNTLVPSTKTFPPQRLQANSPDWLTVLPDNAAVILPLKSANQLLGAIVVGKRWDSSVFDERDLGILSLIAQQATALLHNAQQLEDLRAVDKLRNLLNLYVSPEVAREALAHGATLGGTAVECSILFADIRDFTSISEKMEAGALLQLLNAYMTAMVEAIVSHGGIVNKFGGDSLLAIFGTPINPAADHAAQAVKTAQGMMAALHNFNAIQHESGATALTIGIGVATGTVVAGNMGGRERLEYTVIGNTVNLASRLQDKTKEMDGNILLSAKTHVQAARVMELEGVWETAVFIKGKQQTVKTFRLDNPVTK